MLQGTVKSTPQTSPLAITAFWVGVATFTSTVLLIASFLFTSTTQGTPAITGLIFLALACSVPDLLTLALSAAARQQIKKSGGRLKGQEMALSGLLLGIAIPALLIVTFVAISLH